MNERYIRWWTPHMSRDFEMLVFGDARGSRWFFFPPLSAATARTRILA
jgi:esterase/lipase superfamily enzyme